MQQPYIERVSVYLLVHFFSSFLHARASEQGNVIGLVSVYIYIYVIKKNL